MHRKPDPSLIARGRRTTRLCAGAFVLLTLLPESVHLVRNGIEQLPQWLIHGVIALVVAEALTSGRTWARRVGIVVGAFPLTVTLAAVITDALPQISASRWTLFALQGGAWLAIAWTLLRSPAVRAFFLAANSPWRGLREHPKPARHPSPSAP